MQDGYTQVGAGDSDMRQGGNDLQHARQKSMDSYNSGGPMKFILDAERMQHQVGREDRLEHLERAYKR